MVERTSRQIPKVEPAIGHQPQCCALVVSLGSLRIWARYHVKNDNMTAFKIVAGREYTSSIVQFGEVVMGKLPNVKSVSKGKPRWFKGIFVGRTDIDDAVVVLTDTGAVAVRSIRIGCPPLTNMMSRFWIQRVVYHGP